MFIMEELKSKWTTWEKYSKENEELRNLPPVEIEKIENKFDDPFEENLTENKKRWRSTWEK